MISLMDEIDKLYYEFEDLLSYEEFKQMCFQIHAEHTKQYSKLLFGKQNKKHDIIQVYSQHIAFHVNRIVKRMAFKHLIS